MSANRRDYTAKAADAVMEWWLGGFGNPEADPETHEALMAWWSEDAPDAALEVVHVVFQAISDSGYDIVKREVAR